MVKESTKQSKLGLLNTPSNQIQSLSGRSDAKP